MAASGSAGEIAGRYAGRFAHDYRAPDLLARLAEMPALLASPAARLIASGRNRNVRVELPIHGRNVAVGENVGADGYFFGLEYIFYALVYTFIAPGDKN